MFSSDVARIQYESGSNISFFHSKSPYLVHTQISKSVSKFHKAAAVGSRWSRLLLVLLPLCVWLVSAWKESRKKLPDWLVETQRGALLRFLQTPSCVGATRPSLPGRMLIQLLPVFGGPPVPPLLVPSTTGGGGHEWPLRQVTDRQVGHSKTVQLATEFEH